jgi:hypothetical protein
VRHPTKQIRGTRIFLATSKAIIIISYEYYVHLDRLPTGWTTKESEFESRWGQEFSLLHVVQTGSYPMGIGSSFPGGKAAEA